MADTENIGTRRKMDVLVAEAIGARHVGDVPDSPFGITTWKYPAPVDLLVSDHITFTTKGYGPLLPFSTDWNCAMWAAEHFGLLRSHRIGQFSKCNEWLVLECGFGEEVGRIVTAAPTGPLAICKAILALAEKNEQEPNLNNNEQTV